MAAKVVSAKGKVPHKYAERGLPVFSPFHFIYAHVCLFTLACDKISKSNQNLSS